MAADYVPSGIECEGDRNPVVEAIVAGDGAAIVRRFKHAAGLADDAPVTARTVADFYYIERNLAERIRQSTPANRAQVAEAAYDTYYRNLRRLEPWQVERLPEVDFGIYLKIFPPGARVYEIGSGGGELAEFLTRHGRPCVATEIASTRGEHRREEGSGVAWHGSDGIHIARYEPPQSYDYALSVQLLEHLHPDDIAEHLANVREILRPGGSYVFATPHRFSGPRDISGVFGLPRSDCFHLKEYTYGEFDVLLAEAGFARREAIYVAPQALRKIVPLQFRSRAYGKALIGTERLLERMPDAWRRRAVRLLTLGIVWRSDVFMIATRGA